MKEEMPDRLEYPTFLIRLSEDKERKHHWSRYTSTTGDVERTAHHRGTDI